MSIQWGRVVLAAFVMELVLIGIAVPLFTQGYGQLLVYIIPPASLVATFLTRSGSDEGLPHDSCFTAR
jgi:hypothetical protein